jgi:energy-coupling factor transporter ATP-binding protein EcfA2
MSSVAVLEAVAPVAREAAASPECPFPGLRAFDVEDNQYFYGRDQHLAELLDRFDNQHFLAVIGPSGSGKSSLVRAGLLPELQGGNLAGTSSHWRIGTCLPGDNPMLALATAVASIAHPGGTRPELLEKYANNVKLTLQRSSVGLLQAVGELGLADEESVLIVVDQFEELFTYRDKRQGAENWRDDTASFIDLLLEGLRQGAGHSGVVAARAQRQLYIVITMRTDFLEQCAEFRDLYDALNRGQFLVPRLNDEQQREAILGPLDAVGMTAQHAFVEKVLNDVRHARDELPVLQHALRRTWMQWKAAPDANAPLEITLDHYLRAGGLEGALDRHAEDLFKRLATEDDRKLAQILFRRITRIDSANKRTRDPAELQAIAATAEVSYEKILPVIERFREPEARFLRPARGIPLVPSSKIDVSHEAVFRVWKRAVGWMNQEREAERLLLDLAEAASDYREKGEILSGVRLENAEKWRRDPFVHEAWAKRYGVELEPIDTLLAKSRSQRSRQLFVKLGLLVTSVAFAITLLFYRELSTAKARAEASALEAKKAEAEAKGAEAEAKTARDQEKKKSAELAKKHDELLKSRTSESAARASLAEVEQKRLEAEKSLEKTQLANKKLDADRDAKMRAIERADRDLQRADQNLQKKQQQLAQAEADYSNLLRRIEVTAAGQSDLKRQLQAATFERDQAKASLKAAQAATEQERAKVQKLQRDLDRLSVPAP